MFTSSYQTIINGKRTQRADLVSSASAFNPDKHGYVKATASDIVSNIEKGEWTASEVVEAYIARAALAHAATNCLTEVLFDQARRLAKELDDEFAATKRLRGPLHGVPVSVKDQFEMIGVDASIGFTQWTNKPGAKNAVFVAQVIAAGAIPIAKTNVPQTMFAFECCNPVWGRTLNPHNDAFTCGGSSGGEGALLAMDGSVIGLGSDIGGSLRIPSAYCGIYSLKPTFGRVSRDGAKGPVPGFEGINTVVGPMARSVNDVELASRVVFGHQGPYCETAPLPYRDINLPKKLKFGYYTSDGYVKASPACKRAVLESVEALRREGHECVEVELPNANEAFNIFVGLTSADGFKTMLSHLGPDPKEPSLSLTIAPSFPWFVRAFASWAVETLFGDKLYADGLRSASIKSVREYHALVAKRDEYIRKFYQEIWLKHSLDGLIAPTQALPQLRHGGCTTLSSLAGATILYNVVDSPVGCVPVTRVDPTVDVLPANWAEEPGHGAKLIEKQLYSGKAPFYDPKAMAGMPVGVQIVGKKWEDEKVIAMMGILDSALGEKRGFGPGAYDLAKV
ncbi:hypothetical protein HGRIS_004786 [Hohenbuehelia grisea]|uniref:amidase n=1 Tax=Hohenbuehelia grisea TaxID=104357 RepID=A0ABR3JCZ4_9AGAR